MERKETIIVGAGQAGLATSYCLQQRGREHLVFEQASTPAPVWRNERWDSFTMVTPNWTLNLPGAAYDGPEPDAFTTRAGITDYFDRYVQDNRLPVQCNTRVTAVREQNGKGFEVDIHDRTYLADNVVIATGYDQQPSIPEAAKSISLDITQLHSSRYRNPESLPSGGVLVVGTAQSGAQIAEELYQSGRKVFLSVSNAGRAPRRYRGQDVFKWLFQMGFFDLPPDKMPGPPGGKFVPPHISGKGGGRTLNLHQFTRDGVTLLGHFAGADGHTVSLAPDLHAGLARADGFEAMGKQMIDGYIAAAGIDAPEEELPQLRDGYEQPIIERLDLGQEGITTIVWATGFRHDYGIVKLPVTDEKGNPIQDRGVSRYRGLYFVGMPWMPTLKSVLLASVGEFASEIASTIAARDLAVATA